MFYFDYSATTPVNSEILSAFEKMNHQFYANVGSMHTAGTTANDKLSVARAEVADFLGVKSEEVIFTSGATESNNLIIQGVADARKHEGKHVITTMIEHSSVYDTYRYLEEYHGFEVTYLPVDENCRIKLTDLQAALRSDTILVSIMHVNSEVGSIQPVEAAIELIRAHSNAYIHLDMVQSFTKIPYSFTDLDINFASISMHKIYGLKGSGLLYRRLDSKLVRRMFGGMQEFGVRGGTANTPANMVVGKTIALALKNIDEKHAHVDELHQRLRSFLEQYDFITINTPKTDYSPYIVNFSVSGMNSDDILYTLDEAGICISTKSADVAKAKLPSRILYAMSQCENHATSGVRISLSHLTTEAEFTYLLDNLATIFNNK
ncbi:MAG: cysteine desulfurase family protein [Culicoidibacterales bacterium]